MNLLDSSENGGYGVSRMRKMDTFASSLLTDYSSVEKEGGREGCPNGLLGYTYGPQIHDLQLHSSHSVPLLHAVHWSFGAGGRGGENVRDAICAPGLHQLMVPLCAAPPARQVFGAPQSIVPSPQSLVLNNPYYTLSHRVLGSTTALLWRDYSFKKG